MDSAFCIDLKKKVNARKLNYSDKSYCYKCPHCDQLVSLVVCEERTNHFKHLPGSEPCPEYNPMEYCTSNLEQKKNSISFNPYNGKIFSNFQSTKNYNKLYHNRKSDLGYNQKKGRIKYNFDKLQKFIDKNRKNSSSNISENKDSIKNRDSNESSEFLNKILPPHIEMKIFDSAIQIFLIIPEQLISMSKTEKEQIVSLIKNRTEQTDSASDQNSKLRFEISLNGQEIKKIPVIDVIYDDGKSYLYFNQIKILITKPLNRFEIRYPGLLKSKFYYYNHPIESDYIYYIFSSEGVNKNHLIYQTYEDVAMNIESGKHFLVLPYTYLIEDSQEGIIRSINFRVWNSYRIYQIDLDGIDSIKFVDKNTNKKYYLYTKPLFKFNPKKKKGDSDRVIWDEFESYPWIKMYKKIIPSVESQIFDHTNEKYDVYFGLLNHFENNFEINQYEIPLRKKGWNGETLELLKRSDFKKDLVYGTYSLIITEHRSTNYIYSNTFRILPDIKIYPEKFYYENLYDSDQTISQQSLSSEGSIFNIEFDDNEKYRDWKIDFEPKQTIKLYQKERNITLNVPNFVKELIIKLNHKKNGNNCTIVLSYIIPKIKWSLRTNLTRTESIEWSNKPYKLNLNSISVVDQPNIMFHQNISNIDSKFQIRFYRITNENESKLLIKNSFDPEDVNFLLNLDKYIDATKNQNSNFRLTMNLGDNFQHQIILLEFRKKDYKTFRSKKSNIGKREEQKNNNKSIIQRQKLMGINPDIAQKKYFNSEISVKIPNKKELLKNITFVLKYPPESGILNIEYGMNSININPRMIRVQKRPIFRNFKMSESKKEIIKSIDKLF